MVGQDRPDDEAGHQANVNQVQDEPMPASRQDDRQQGPAQENAEQQRETKRDQRQAESDDRAPASESMSKPTRATRPGPRRRTKAGPGQPDGKADPVPEETRS